MERTLMFGSLTQSFVELELDDEADKVPTGRATTSGYCINVTVGRFDCSLICL